MLTKLFVENFKCLRRLEIPLDQFTVFIGANGSGKTTILEAIAWLCRYQHTYTTLDRANMNQAAQGLPEVKIAGAVDFHTIIEHSQITPTMKEFPARIRCVPDFSLFSFVPRTVLVSHRNYIKESSRLLEIEQDLAKIVDGIVKIKPAIVGLYPSTVLFDTHAKKGMNAALMSEGVLAVYNLLEASDCFRRSMLIDDLGRCLHPKAQRKLARLIQDKLKDTPDLQIIATTNSPDLLEEVPYRSVRVLAIDAQGNTVCKPLTEHPEYPRWEKEFNPGDFWSFCGEEWVLENKSNSNSPESPGPGFAL